MRICILGLGVIGTTYGYAFQKAGHQVEHWIREEKRLDTPRQISIHILDGRYRKKGEEREDSYVVTPAEPDTAYDFILVSVANGKLQEAAETIRHNGLTGSILLFCNFWNDREELSGMLGKLPYVIGFPAAGERMEDGTLNCVLFDHVMLEREAKACISNYPDLQKLLETSDLKAECPHDMVEWIWLHMAVNAGVTSTAAQSGSLKNPRQLALNLMGDAPALAEAVRTIRETFKVISARGVNLKFYRSEIMPYQLPAAAAGVIMKRMFSQNELTSRIMTLHNDVSDILYGCLCVLHTAEEKKLQLPGYFEKMERILDGMKL